MGLFDFSKGKKPQTEIKDLIWINQTAKMDGCRNLINQNPDSVIIAWFLQTLEDFNKYLNEQNNLGVEIQMARSVSSIQATDKTIIILEHYPLPDKEENLILSLSPKKIFILSSLDEPLFIQFGGERIIEMMKNMGMKEDEVIEHPMISKAIKQAQIKLEKQLTIENSANSQKEWLERNASK